MKRFICIAIAIALMAGAIIYVARDKNNGIKMGLGICTSVTKASDATEENDGEGAVEITAAAVMLDKDGRIISCYIDTAACNVKYTKDGKATANGSFKTKYELGYDYSMKKYGAAHEWFEQVDAFTALCKGKTLDEVKALVVNGYKGNDDVIAAGCTIGINDFVIAIEKACNNARDCEAVPADKLKMGTHTEQTVRDAGENDGESKLETTFFAAAIDPDGKIVAAVTDCVEVKFAFSADGASKTDIAKAILSKRELGDSYGMVAYMASDREWYTQADAFAATCIGKTAGDVESLMGDDGKGSADVQNAGCTIVVNGFVSAASKIK